MDRYGLICRSIYEDSDVTQRELSSILGISLGSVNKLVGECLKDGLIQNHSEYGKYSLTEKGMEYLLMALLSRQPDSVHVLSRSPSRHPKDFLKFLVKGWLRGKSVSFMRPVLPTSRWLWGIWRKNLNISSINIM